MSKRRHLLLIAGFLLMTAPAGVGQVNTAKPGEPVERHLSSDQTFREWTHDSNGTDETKLIKVCRAQTVCKMRYREGQTPRTRVRNLVVPLRYEDENTHISDAFTKQIRQALDNLRDKRGVTVRFIGYTDDVPLTRKANTYETTVVPGGKGARIALPWKSWGCRVGEESDVAGPHLPQTKRRGRAESSHRGDSALTILSELSDRAATCPDDVDETLTGI
jgi:hypothetical protein